jgi:hypothetical protein
MNPRASNNENDSIRDSKWAVPGELHIIFVMPRGKQRTLQKIQKFIRKKLRAKLVRDLQGLRIVKEADVECAVYHHLRRYIGEDPLIASELGPFGRGGSAGTSRRRNSRPGFHQECPAFVFDEREVSEHPGEQHTLKQIGRATKSRNGLSFRS